MSKKLKVSMLQCKHCGSLSFMFFVLLSLFYTNFSYSQSYKWDNVRIGGGGYVTGMVAHPTEPDLIYIRTDTGGAYRYESPNEEHPDHPEWIPITEWIPFEQDGLYGVDGIAVDPNNPDVVFAYLGGYDWVNYSDLYKSTDRGVTWTKCNLNKRARGNQGERWVGESIAVMPGNSDVVIVGTRYDGLWRSNNGGTVWAQVSGIPIDASGNGVRSVIFDPNSPNKVYCAVRGHGVYQSTDGGDSWTFISGTNNSSRQLAVASDGTLYISADNAVFKYKDDTLTNIAPNTSLSYNAITVDPADPDFLVVVQFGHRKGLNIWRTFNGGSTWNNIYTNAPQTNAVPWYSEGHFSSAVSSILINPHNTDELYFSDWFLVWKSENIKATTPAFSSVPWGHEELVIFDIAALPSDGLFIQGCADNGGLKHTDVTKYPTFNFGNQEATGIDFCEAKPEVYVRVSSDGWGQSNFNISKSVNGGVTWSRIHSPGTTGKIAMSSKDENNMIFAPTGGNRNLQYTINGTTWQNSTGIPTTTFNSSFWSNYNKPIASDKINGDKFYCFVGGTLYISTDKGASFNAASATKLPTGSGNPARDLKASPYAEGHLWLSLRNAGLYYSTNSGSSFTKVSYFDDSQLVAIGPAIEGNAQPTIYAYARNSTHGWGVYRSADSGATWTKITTDSIRISNFPRVMEADRQNPGRVYIGTNGRGIYYGDDLSLSHVNVTGVEVDSTASFIQVGETLNLNATVIPEEATNKIVIWTSSNSSIATVNHLGQVTGMEPGLVTITTTTDDGKKTATRTISVRGEAIHLNLLHELNAIHDSYVSEDQPAIIHHDTNPQELQVSLVDTSKSYSFLKFEIPQDLADQPIEAILTLWGGNVYDITGVDLEVVLADNEWDEQTLNWENRPDFVDQENNVEFQFPYGDKIYGYVDVDVSSLLQDKQGQKVTLAIRNVEINEENVIFFSKDQNDKTKAPMLTIYKQKGVSVEGMMTGKLSVYPNPVTDRQVFVSVGDVNAGVVHVEVISMDGRIVMNQRINLENGVNVLNLAANIQNGVYLLNISGNKQNYISRIVVQ